MSQYFDAERTALRAMLEPGEAVMGEGRCEAREVLKRRKSSFLSQVYTGGGRSYLLVTDRRVLCFGYEVPFDLVERYTPVVQGRRWGVILHHRPIRRRVRVPKRFLIFAYGSKVVTRTFRKTVLGFSRVETEAAIALRTRLESRRIPAAAPRVRRDPSRARRERSSGMLYRIR